MVFLVSVMASAERFGEIKSFGAFPWLRSNLLASPLLADRVIGLEGAVWEPQREWTRPMEPKGKSKCDMTMPVCNVCIRRGIRSQVCRLIGELSLHSHLSDSH